MQDQRSNSSGPAKLIVFGGLPGVGKSTIARELAREIGGVYLRIDSIEQALRDSGGLVQPLDDTGYRVAYTLAADNLRLGRTVVADCVNPISITRDAWLEIANRAGVRALEVELQCSDAAEHRSRVETRAGDIPGLIPPTWDEVLTREYECWDREHVVVDTATKTTEQILSAIRRVLQR